MDPVSINPPPEGANPRRVQIGRNVASEMVRRGWEPVTPYLANVLDIHPSTARRKVAGKAPFDSDELDKLGAWLKVPPSVFLSGMLL